MPRTRTVQPAAPIRDNSVGRQRVINRMMRGILNSPLHGLMSRRLTLLYVTGRKSGARYAVPLAYTDHEGQILLVSPGSWVRNLRGGATLEVQHHGRRFTATAEVAEDPDRAWEIAVALLPPNPVLRRFQQIELDETGLPRRDQVEAAQERGARFIALQPAD